MIKKKYKEKTVHYQKTGSLLDPEIPKVYKMNTCSNDKQM